MPSTAASNSASAAFDRISSRTGIADSAPSIPNRFVPTYLVARNFSKLSAAFSRSRMRCLRSFGHLGLRALELLLDPLLFVGVLDVHVLHTDGAAVGVAQHAEQVAESHLLDAADAVGEELAVEVPDGEAVGGRIEFARREWFLPPQRIEVGDQVAAHPMDPDQLGDGHLLGEHRLFAVDGERVGPPLDRLVGHVERLEHVLVEVVFAEQQLVHPLEEQARLGALDDAVVVGARDRDDLADAERAEVAAVGALELGRVVDAADADDDRLAGHQSRDRLHGADRAGVGEADVGALEVVDGELVGLDLADDLLVGGEEAVEVEGVGVAEHGDHERATAGLLDVDGQTHADVLVLDEPRFAVGTFGVGVLHRRDLVGDGAHDGIADEVGEADLGLPGAGAEPVDHLAVDLEQLRRHVAEAGRRRDGEAALHVGGDGGAGAADRLAGLLVGAGGSGGGASGRRASRSGGGCRGGRRRCRRCRGGCSRRVSGAVGFGVVTRRPMGLGDGLDGGRGGGGSGDTRSLRLIVGEELLPRIAHRCRFCDELLVHLLDEP
jgi:hypothetical protein